MRLACRLGLLWGSAGRKPHTSAHAGQTIEPTQMSGERDIGLQNERTSLAWVRTSIAFAVIGGLLLRGSHLMVAPAVGYVLGAAVLGAAATALSGQHARYDVREARMDAGDGALHQASLRALSFATIAACASAAIGVVLLVA